MVLEDNQKKTSHQKYIIEKLDNKVKNLRIKIKTKLRSEKEISLKLQTQNSEIIQSRNMTTQQRNSLLKV